MAKRFTATEKWDKAWYMKLSPKLKCLWQYLNDKCDQAGVWDENFIIATAHIGDTITEEDMSAFGDRVEKIAPEKWWVTGHVKFQCGELSQKCKAHNPIIKSLKENNLFERVTKGYTKGYIYPLDTLQEKEIEKEKEKEIGGVGDFEISGNKPHYEGARQRMQSSDQWQDNIQTFLSGFGVVVSHQQLHKWIDLYVNEQLAKPGNDYKDERGIMEHFQHWSRKRGAELLRVETKENVVVGAGVSSRYKKLGPR